MPKKTNKIPLTSKELTKSPWSTTHQFSLQTIQVNDIISTSFTPTLNLQNNISKTSPKTNLTSQINLNTKPSTTTNRTNPKTTPTETPTGIAVLNLDSPERTAYIQALKTFFEHRVRWNLSTEPLTSFKSLRTTWHPPLKHAKTKKGTFTGYARHNVINTHHP